jgi:hypothetical protein
LVVGEIKIDVSCLLGDADVDGALGSVKLGSRLSRSSSEEIVCALRALPVVS